MDRQIRRARILVGVIISLAVAGMSVASPMDGDFSWTDASRHALNGAFLRDFIAELPLDAPREWAVNYYLKYPAVTILLYPPLFYAVEALAFTLFGVSHATAQYTVLLFAAVLMMSSYRLARLWLQRWSALAVALLVLGVPEVMFWGRQVMLDVPAYAMAVTSAFFFARHLRSRVNRDLYWAAATLVASTWIKLNTVFLLPVFAVIVAATGVRPFVRNRGTWYAATLVGVGLLLPVLLTLEFGAVNVQSVAGRPGDFTRYSLDAWLFYARLLPAYLGYVVLPLSVIGIALLVRRRRGHAERELLIFAVTWFVIGYVFFSFIGVREPRHGVMMLLPAALLAVSALETLLSVRTAQMAAMAVGVVFFGSSMVRARPPVVPDYPAVAEFVTAQLPRNGVVLFSGQWDGNFIFALRTQEERRDVTTIRADKLFVETVAGERQRGVTQTRYSRADVDQLLRGLGIDLVVVDAEFWSDLQQMRQFIDVVRGESFESIARFEIHATRADQRHVVEVYRPRYPVVKGPRRLELNMPNIGDRFGGALPSE